MYMFCFSFPILFSILIKTDGQYNLYYTNPLSQTNLYYDCLYYKAFDNIVSDSLIRSFHQIIPYCIRPLNKNGEPQIETIRNTIYSNFTFEELKEQNVTAQDLLFWSASIDLVERYQNYLDTSTVSLGCAIFFNCTFLRFGSQCQYTFESNEPFGEILHKTFLAKNYDKSAESRYNITTAILAITNLTCYMHLACNRGPVPLCLDWREICDGQIDCLNDAIDEKRCLDLELNECEENEYRCHNGICIPEQFINDNPNNPDCLDHTDENDAKVNRFDQLVGHLVCYQNPTFLCEESNPFSSYRGFQCGDGQQINVLMAGKLDILNQAKFLHCSNGRDLLLVRTVLVNALRFSNLSLECRFVMFCIAFGIYENSCIKFLCMNQNFPCSLPIQTVCNTSTYVILPLLPITQAYAQFGHWTNKSIIFESPNHIPWPDFVCYDMQFLSSSSSSDFEINNLTCYYISDMATVIGFEYIGWFLRSFLSIDDSGNLTDCFYASLFHCRNTSRCISKHRLLDGVIDCTNGDDEQYMESCSLNDRHRFRCTSENKCISPVLVHDMDNHCHAGEDEHLNLKQSLPFQYLCDGYRHILPMLIDEQNETDETNCEDWPCNNPYTQCDRAWRCSNGADEVNCDPTSICYPDHHECISPITFNLTCLAMDQAGDGIDDCLGATDEEEYCQRMYSENVWKRYKCLNSTTCIEPTCEDLNQCPLERNSSFKKVCEENEQVKIVLLRLILQSFVANFNMVYKKYFVLDNTSRFQSNASFTRLISLRTPTPIPYSYASRVHTRWLEDVLPRAVTFQQAWMCNRGILIFVGLDNNEHCLCPPSYYGNRCQYQQQRVSLTLQFTKECAPSCYGVYTIIVTLISNQYEIQTYEQLTYISTNSCNMKHNIYLLYQSRPKNLTKNYTIQIHAYNKIDLTYYTSWILPVKFLFLPVNRIAAYLIIPSTPTNIPNNCSLNCGDHGACAMYTNTEEYFCRCHPGWSGQNCTDQHDNCDCSPKSICLGTINNQSICLCPPNKFGPRCFIDSICQQNPCKNDGQCISEDDRISMNNFTCICKSGYSGSICEVEDTRIEISFRDVKIPQSLTVHFVTVQNNNDPLLTTIVKRIGFDQDTVVLYTSILFNLIFIEINNEYYLGFLQVHASPWSNIELEMKNLDHCSTVQSLLDEQRRKFPLLRRVKYYHTLCQKHTQLSCIHDNEAFMCLCHEDGYANCFSFDFNKTSICPGRTICENQGQCVSDHPTCPTSTMCICHECYYGGRCQFTTNTFGLSLEAILGYQFRSYISILRQPIAIKVSIALTTIMFVFGSINSILSTMTFRLKTVCNVGCGFYLLTLSIVSFIITIIFTFKFWLLILSQLSFITNRTFLIINCISMEFVLRSLLSINDWLSACVAIERVVVVMKSTKFNQVKSKRIARWAILIIIICTLGSLIHDPIHRRLIYDEEEQRTWCILQYSSPIQIFDSSMHIIHFFIPFSINIISAAIIIVMVARTYSTVRRQKTYRQHLYQQFHQQKHHIISPIILVILAFPRLIISFLSGCMKSIRNPWLYLIGYFISFTPSLLTFVVFILPSETYKSEFNTIIKQYQSIIVQYFHRQ